MNQVQKPIFITCATNRICLSRKSLIKDFNVQNALFQNHKATQIFIEMIPTILLIIGCQFPKSLLNSMKQIIFKEKIKICDWIIQKLHTFKQKTEQQERYQQLQEQFKQIKQQFFESILYSDFCEKVLVNRNQENLSFAQISTYNKKKSQPTF